MPQYPIKGQFYAEGTIIKKAERKKDWALGQGAFRQLLAWLDGETDSGGERYLEMRRRLVSYFDRKNCLAADELTDETLNRVARRLEEEGTITGVAPAQYCYIVAKFVFLESLRHPEANPLSLDELPESAPPALNPATPVEPHDERQREEARLNCLEQCLGKLDADNRDLLVQYYEGEQGVKIDNRRRLAERLGISANALSIRACRIRDRLELCVGKCLNPES
jgi:DNA-directed RNA polymerase specialized sigma24 family protein